MVCGATREDGGVCDCPKRMPVPEKSAFNNHGGTSCEIHIKDDAKPVACYKATSIPLDWQKTVESDLKRDEAL